MSGVSSHWPCLKPTERSVPTISKSGRGVKRDRCGLRGIADDRDHLAKAAPLAFLDQTKQQQFADAAAMKLPRDID